ncbi:hypothetical protein ACFO5Q_15765 [Kordiimonas lipolytica]|uniref:Uncharacterized protein n=1 Tax=Kordiimonas lipolytica TaxID=1662421 RepID=A0ABV8UFS3_9PROT|nr:hypothetical protein [Kordiimonas lipolytica]
MAEEYQYSWDSDDWENFCHRLLQLRYKPTNVVKVPHQDRGDLGIEFYSNHEGTIYQCYAPEHPTTKDVRVHKIRAKINKDINKLKKYESSLTTLFSGLPIKRWVLVVPLMDSKRVTLALPGYSNKVRGYGLPFIDASFQVMVHDQSDFATQITQLRRKAGQSYSIQPPTVSDDHVSPWIDENAVLAQTLLKKLQRGFPDLEETTLNKRFQNHIKRHLEGENLMDDLRIQFPDMYEEASKAVQRARSKLETLGPASTNPRSILEEQIDAIKDYLSSQQTQLAGHDIDVIALGAVVSWLMECPLDFPEMSNAT